MVGYACPVASGVWRSLVARYVRDVEAAGSNPVTPTITDLPETPAKRSAYERLCGLRRGSVPSTQAEVVNGPLILSTS